MKEIMIQSVVINTKSTYQFLNVKFQSDLVSCLIPCQYEYRTVSFQIKLKLNNDLKTNFKHTERYLKYLDIAEEITKTKSKPGTGTCF